MNFNDFGSSLVTLFHQMVVNNWFVTVGMLSDITGHQVATHFYFVTFWMAIVLVLLNIVIAIVLEIFGSVTNQVEAEMKTTKMQIQLHKWLEGCDEETMKKRIDEALAVINEYKTDQGEQEDETLSCRSSSAFESSRNET